MVVDLATLDVQVIAVPMQRLDHPDVRRKLNCTIASVAPGLLILDPFVRLHRIHASAEDASLLAELLEL